MNHSRLDERSPGDMIGTKRQLQQTFAAHGSPIGFERIAQKAYGTSIVRLIYVAKYAEVAIVWNFYFYRASHGWDLRNFNFNDLLRELE